jgi:hypothetical protein
MFKYCLKISTSLIITSWLINSLSAKSQKSIRLQVKVTSILKMIFNDLRISNNGWIT